MAVTHAPAGYTGTVDQIAEAQRFALSGGGRFRVSSATDWALSASGSTRTVNIAAGFASCCGVTDVTTIADTVTFAANAGGSNRYDAVVATFDWSAGTVSFRVIQGTTVVPTIVRTGTTVDATKINWLPGIRYDAVLGVIQVRPGVTALAPADLFDNRPWGSWAKLNVASAAFGSLVDTDVGSKMLETSTGHQWEWTGPTYGWQPSPGLLFTQNMPDSGFSTVGATNQGMSASSSSMSATAPGPCQVELYGEAISSANFGGWLTLGWNTSSSTVGINQMGGARRVANFNNPSVPVSFNITSFFDNPGGPIWFFILASTDAGSTGGIQLTQNVISVFRL